MDGPIEEKNLVLCKVCGILKYKITVAKYANNQKRYVGEDDLMWNGKICGPCHQKEVRDHKNTKKKS